MTERSHSTTDLAQRLLDLEPPDPALRADYERKLVAMWEPQLSTGRRIAWAASGVLGLCFLVFFTYLAIIMPAKVPIVVRVSLGLGALFGLASAVMAFRIVRRGTMKLKTDPMTVAGMTWGFVVVMVTIFMLVGSAAREIWAVQMVVNGLVFLVGAAVILLRTVIEQAENRTQEKLVELEYRIALLSRKLGNDDASVR
jgi:hypothetical protein